MEQIEAINWVRVISILALGTVAWIVAQRLAVAVKRLLITGEVDRDSEKRALTLVRAARYALSTVVVLVVVMLLLSEFGISIAPLLGAAGVAGVALGLASQGIARDFLRGFSLLLNNQLRVGDVVEIAGKAGMVEAVTMSTVRLREYDGSVHFIRTGDVGTVTNRSYGRIYAVLDVAVDTAAETSAVYAAIREAADALRADPAFASQILGPVEIAGIDRWEDDAVVVRSRIPVEPHAQVPVRRALLARTKAAMDRAGIPNPTQRIRLLGTDAK